MINFNKIIFQIYKQKIILNINKFFFKIFQTIYKNIFFIFILHIIIKTSNIVDCTPWENFMEKDTINNRAYFYYGKVEKIVIKGDLKFLLENFSTVNFELGRYLDINGKRFDNRHPNDHFNLILSVQNDVLNNHYSFTFTHGGVENIPQYHEILSNKDWNENFNKKHVQLWKPYISVNSKQAVKVCKFNMNTNNYMLDTGLHYMIYDIFKLYFKK
jgi:hypothetical protein